MPKEEISIEDIRQQYLEGICLYEGEPVYVLSVNADRKTAIRYLCTAEKKTVEFSMEKFASPAVRLGMLNTEYGAVYVRRTPVRNMSVSVNRNNIRIDRLPDVEYMGDGGPGAGWGVAHQSASRLSSIEWGQMIKGDYPDFRTCIEFVKDFDTAIAFDRQFAIDQKFQIFYKHIGVVGNLPKNCRSIERIVFKKEYEHLNLLIGDNCVQALRIAA